MDVTASIEKVENGYVLTGREGSGVHNTYVYKDFEQVIEAIARRFREVGIGENYINKSFHKLHGKQPEKP